MGWFGKREEDAPVLKSSRDKCYQARDAFYSCMDELADGFELGRPVPPGCRAAREAYEACCKRSWVQHFDNLRDKDVKLVKQLHGQINKTHQDARGVQAGTNLGGS